MAFDQPIVLRGIGARIFYYEQEFFKQTSAERSFIKDFNLRRKYYRKEGNKVFIDPMSEEDKAKLSTQEDRDVYELRKACYIASRLSADSIDEAFLYADNNKFKHEVREYLKRYIGNENAETTEST